MYGQFQPRVQILSRKMNLLPPVLTGITVPCSEEIRLCRHLVNHRTNMEGDSH